MKALGRLAIVAIGIGWYVAVRSVIYFYFLGHGNGTARRGDDFFQWWWSWGIAIPITAVSIMAAGGALMVLGWILFGDDEDEKSDDAKPAVRHHKPPTVQ